MARIAYPNQKLVDIGLDAFQCLDREPIYARTPYTRHPYRPPPTNYYPQKPFYPTYQKPKFAAAHAAEPQQPQTLSFTTYQPPKAYLVQRNPDTGKEEVVSTAAFWEYDHPHYGDYPRKPTAMAATAAAYY